MKLLLEHLKNNKDALLQYSKLIGAANHPGNLGVAREGLISNFLKQNLPEFIRYHTGEIFDRHPIGMILICPISKSLND